MLLPIDADTAFPVGPDGEPLLIDDCLHPTSTRVTLPDGTEAVRLDGVRAAELGYPTGMRVPMPATLSLPAPWPCCARRTPCASIPPTARR
ncbi:hypothetical protein JKI95_03910 [Corynebacterium aquatimens]|uniref:hypothetical protein n=1 Tax=Corynebacterium aquatimens TaxID=1190508 RepID=UPI002540E60F|nr:hypothetical protein [Corynebacterium aquatimens]QYH20134.1 hypothetical protein JKI95_03910 [Corynebacterium aquatimens]